MMSSSPPLVPLLSLLFSSLCSLALSGSIVTRLPGFTGPLPFHLETGYVGVDERNDTQLFYYFIESERSPREDPLLLWLTGGPGCSAFSGLVFEMGPLKFRSVKYNGSLPTLVYHPYSWTKVANVIFLDSPVGTGFSFSRRLEDYDEVGDISSSKHVYKFLTRWFIDHPQFLPNPFYVAGDSFAGKVAPVIAQEILEGIESGLEPLLNLKIAKERMWESKLKLLKLELLFQNIIDYRAWINKGYLIGNPSTGDKIDKNARVPYGHNMGIISDELYEMTCKNCEGQDYENPSTAQCATVMEVVNKFFDEINDAQILEPKCARASPKPKGTYGDGRFLKEERAEILEPPPLPALNCRSYAYYLLYYWANSNVAQEALHVQKGTIGEWERCSTKFDYTADIPNNIKYHLSVTSKGYRALIYSGDHDMVVPFLGTEEWIRSLNYSIVDDWRSWHVGGQVAGYTRTYQNNLTFATVKGAGHTGPEYKPKQCLAMVRRWLSHKPL